jgi:glyoxylase-like metal-dependent hydrolase (beta-lactamase superfamily II)
MTGDGSSTNDHFSCQTGDRKRTSELRWVDTFLTVEQSSGLADAIVASGKTLKAIYITHAHGDHFFGIKVLQDRFPSAKALATPAVIARMKLQATPEKLNSRWRKLFPNQIPDVISVARR